MADEVFALSPISASPALPGEADYDAIRDAFMETSRGRWFLGEYAKRNRNSDTGMVLDAVARIEQALAAQRPNQQSDDNALPEALAKIRAALDDAKQTAAGALEELRIEQKLTPVRIGIRIIKEISWRWREIGTDSRICDLIDSQVSAIDAACEQLTGIDPQPALAAAFETIKAQLDTLEGVDPATAAGNDVAAQGKVAEPTDQSQPPSNQTVASAKADAKVPNEVPVTEAVAVTKPVKPAATVASAEPVAELAPAKADPGEPVVASAAAQPTADMEPDLGALEAEISAAAADVQQAQQVLEVQEEIDQEADQDLQLAQDEAEDDAVLELVAMEMASDDPIDDEEFGPAPTVDSAVSDPIALDDDIIAITPPLEAQISEPEIAAPPTVPTPPTVSAPATPPVALEPLAAAPALQIVPKKSPYESALHEGSLGSSLLANGLVQRPRVASSDPLTPIRRMSQPEKIAFFS